MSKIADPIRIGVDSGWKVVDGSRLTQDVALECDVAIVGSGAGGGTAAELLSQAGLKVVIVEEGPLKSSSDFRTPSSTRSRRAARRRTRPSPFCKAATWAAQPR
jgi:choline dehydrogenase-like flavoprotein